MKKALIYCRVSTEEQAREGYSLDAQEKFCRTYAENNGYKVTGVFRDEGKSGTSLNRPALQELLTKCQQDHSIALVIVQETDRLARNTQDHLAVRALLKKAGVALVSVAQPMLDDSPEGRMIDTILASVNQFQSDINSRKVKKGMQEKFDSGIWPHHAPLGYLNKTINERRMIVSDPERWHLVKAGLKMYLTGNYSALEIAEKLYQKGLQSRNGKMICNSIMIKILRNPFYAGIMQWSGQERIGTHRTMISMKEHHQILTTMDAHNLHACRRRKHSFLLNGFVFCAICGQRYTAEKHRKGKSVDYYHCAARSRKHSNKGQNIIVKELEKQVAEQFRKIQFSQDFIELVIEKVKKFYEKNKSKQEALKRAILNKRMNIERKREIAEEKLIAGVLGNEDFTRIRDRFKTELESIQQELDELDSQREIDIETIRKVLVLTRNIYQSYKTASYEMKRLYLSFFWEGFLVRDKRIVEAKPTELFRALIDQEKVILRGKRWAFSKFIIILQNWQYMSKISHLLQEIYETARLSK